jgi:hypothetical protein
MNATGGIRRKSLSDGAEERIFPRLEAALSTTSDDHR